MPVAAAMGYYQVSLKRKQQAIRSVGPLAFAALETRMEQVGLEMHPNKFYRIGLNA